MFPTTPILTLPRMPMFPAFTGTTNKALTAALDDLPDYTAHVNALGVLDTALREASAALLEATRARVEVVQLVADLARKGKPAPKDLAARCARSAVDQAAAQAHVNVLREADDQVKEDREQILTTAPAALLAHLHDQLDTVLGHARHLGIGHITTAQEAIDADLTDRWRDYAALTEDYLEIRTAQQSVVVHLIGGDSSAQHLATFGAVRNYAEQFPGWFDRDRGKVLGTFNGEDVYPMPAWDEHDPAGVWRHAVAVHDVELWVPTARETAEAYRAALIEARRREQQEIAEEGMSPEDIVRLRAQYAERKIVVLS